jgi:hypothetical protein
MHGRGHYKTAWNIFCEVRSFGIATVVVSDSYHIRCKIWIEAEEIVWNRAYNAV